MPERDCIDDDSITGPSRLLRRIPPYHVVPDPKNGGLRPSSAAFDNDRGSLHMSVNLADIMAVNAVAEETMLDEHPEFSLAAITKTSAAHVGQMVMRDALQDNAAHGSVCGEKPRPARQHMARSAVWVLLRR
jgi:hypothetical protein